jgi:hypothetical protein
MPKKIKPSVSWIERQAKQAVEDSNSNKSVESITSQLGTIIYTETQRLDKLGMYYTILIATYFIVSYTQGIEVSISGVKLNNTDTLKKHTPSCRSNSIHVNCSMFIKFKHTKIILYVLIKVLKQ